ncbi:MAG: hypothetical protein K2P90_04140 [Holosporales bacterium]|nr:hypothetical protein [Holosporales bacterium]
MGEIISQAPEGFSVIAQPDGSYQIVEMAYAEGKTFKNYAPGRDPKFSSDLCIVTAAPNGFFLKSWTDNGLGASHFILSGGEHDGAVVNYIPNYYKPQMSAHFNDYTKISAVVISDKGVTEKEPLVLSSKAQENFKKILEGQNNLYVSNIYKARGSYVSDGGDIVQGSGFSSGNVDMDFLSSVGFKTIEEYPEFKDLVAKNK